MSISRWDILNHVRQIPGFLSLSMSEPLKSQNFVRYAWVSFENEEYCRRAKEIMDQISLKNYNLNPVKSVSQRKGVKVTPPLSEGAEERDLKLTENLIRNVLDPEKGIDPAITNQLFAYNFGTEAGRIKQLDL